MYKKLVFFFILSLSPFSRGLETPESFVVRIYDEKVRVLGPQKYDPTIGVLVENKTMTSLRAKVESASGAYLHYLSLRPGESVSLKLKDLDKERIFFIPLSPGFQKVELKLGNKPYEIPPHSQSL